MTIGQAGLCSRLSLPLLKLHLAPRRISTLVRPKKTPKACPLAQRGLPLPNLELTPRRVYTRVGLERPHGSGHEATRGLTRGPNRRTGSIVYETHQAVNPAGWIWTRGGGAGAETR